MKRRPSLARLLIAAAATATLAGCATLSDDGGFSPVEQTARERLGKEVRWARSDQDRALIAERVDTLLAQPLTMDAAVQLALLNNRGLQADFFELGITEAEVVQAGSLPNPGFSFSRLTRGSEVELERGWHLNLARLLALPLVREAESRRFAQAQGTAATRVLALAADTRKAWVQAVAAEEAVRYSGQVVRAAEASAELARRMAQAGNYNKLQQLREQSFYADAALGLARAEQAQRATRERLTRLLGLWGTQTTFRLPERLPDLPAAPREQPDIERRAIAERLDVQAARLATEQTARHLGLTRTTRFVDVLELGVLNNGSSEAPTQRGWEVTLELPLFDWGTAKVARAESVYRQALNRAAEAAINARSEVREAYGSYRSAWDIAKHHRDELVPLKQRIAEEDVLRYNGMLIGVFELLADARSQIASVNAAIDALRDFWLADAELEMALVGPSGASMAFATPASAANAAAEPAGGGH
ncbi:TolC family protein [Ideonella sp.]|uniref:TolC family protein n=1 Tax=Ideonella sp. TaxID=1929293 RepID=UPI002B4911FE|nr:TolC family protein [Ideonella sp.]HJV70117.1 TolC family protein [Ideonella sp.]